MYVLLLIASLVLFKIGWLLGKIMISITPKELKRRARSGRDPLAARLHKLVAYGASANLFLWLITGLGFIGLIILAQSWPWWSVSILVLFIAWLLWYPKPFRRYGNIYWQAASWLALLLAKIISWLEPILIRLAAPFDKFTPARTHTGVYEKQDLLELMSFQNHLVDNRVPESDLKLAFNSLQFGDKTVGSIMRPRKSVMWVSEEEIIGPILMDELHSTNLDSLPVVKGATKKSASPEVVGTLYLVDLIDHPGGGKIGGLMHRKVYFINESDELRQAMGAFSKTHHHMLVVVNNFEEVVGILTFEMVTQQILGDKLGDDFDGYESKQAIAKREEPKDKPKPEKP